jgi:hypothetical protein
MIQTDKAKLAKRLATYFTSSNAAPEPFADENIHGVRFEVSYLPQDVMYSFYFDWDNDEVWYFSKDYHGYYVEIS